MDQDPDRQVSSYDRQRGQLQGIAMFTKPSTVKSNPTFINKCQTFIVETARHDELGDFIFVEAVDENLQVIRLALPPKVANAIAAQRDRLTSRRRSIAGRRIAKERAEAGLLPGFMKGKK